MKSLAQLAALRDKMKPRLALRHDALADTRVVVAMGTCGIAAGAREVLSAFVEQLYHRGISHVTVTQSGCSGVCALEPVVEILTPGQEKVTYVVMTPEKVARVIDEHLANGRVVTEYTIGAAQ